jgi:hypothetical protein
VQRFEAEKNGLETYRLSISQGVIDMSASFQERIAAIQFKGTEDGKGSATLVVCYKEDGKWVELARVESDRYEIRPPYPFKGLLLNPPKAILSDLEKIEVHHADQYPPQS